MSSYPPLSGASLRSNMAISLDGRTTVDNRSAGLSSPTDRTLFRHLRATSQVILVGLGTALAETYAKPHQASGEYARWRTALGLPLTPRLVIATSHPDSCPLNGADAAVTLPSRITMDELGKLVGLNPDLPGGILCEGGPHFLEHLAERRLVDEYCLSVTTKFVGEGNLSLVPRPLANHLCLTMVSVMVHPDGIFLRLRPSNRTGADKPDTPKTSDDGHAR